MQNWLLLVANRASARGCTGYVTRKYPRALQPALIGASSVGAGGEFTRKKPRSKIVNTFSHSPIFRATTAQPLVKSHASSSPTRIGAPFRRPLRHSIVRFRAPTTPESRKRNDHVPFIGVLLPMCLHVARTTRSPRSASRFPRMDAFNILGSDVAVLLYCVYLNLIFCQEKPFFFSRRNAYRLIVAIT